MSPSNEYSELISIRMDWVDLLAVQGTLKSRLQHHSLKASVLRCSAFFTVRLSHPYMTTGKTRALTSRTFVGKVMSLLLNMLSRLVITFLPRNPRVDLLQNGLVGTPCSPRDFQEASPTPQFKSINSSVLSLLRSPTLTSIHDHWENHSLD